jgi:hypothetical protein
MLLIIALAIALFYSLKKNIELMEQLDEVKDQVEESLDVLDFVYGRIYDKSQIEVLSDEPLVRELLQDIKAAKDTMIIVANKIVLPLSEDEDEE